MSSQYPQPYPPVGGSPKQGPSRWWYTIAAALAIGSLIVATMIGFSVADKFEGASIKPVGEDDTIEITAAKQLAVYSDAEMDARLTCTATPDNGGAPVEFSNPTASLTINSWNRIALSPKDTAAGSYALSCTPGSSLSADVSHLGVGNNPEIGGAIGRIVGALAVGGLGMLIALVIVIVTAVRRYKAS